MKNDKILFLVLIILFWGFTPLYSQNYSINISGGIGYPEFNHIGVGVNYKNSQIQTTIGRTSEPNYDYTSVTCNIFDILEELQNMERFVLGI